MTWGPRKDAQVAKVLEDLGEAAVRPGNTIVLARTIADALQAECPLKAIEDATAVLLHHLRARRKAEELQHRIARNTR